MEAHSGYVNVHNNLPLVDSVVNRIHAIVGDFCHSVTHQQNDTVGNSHCNASQCMTKFEQLNVIVILYVGRWINGRYIDSTSVCTCTYTSTSI